MRSRALWHRSALALLASLAVACSTPAPEDPSPSPTSEPIDSPAPSPDPVAEPCAPPGDLAIPEHDWKTLASDDGPILSLEATSDVPGDLAASDELWIRVTTRDGEPAEVYLDVSGERSEGAWAYQTQVAANAWELFIDSYGHVHTHADAPDQWNWLPTIRDHVRWSHGDGQTVVCLPTRLLAHGGEQPDRVAIAVASDHRWLPATFLAGADYPPMPEIQAAPARRPGRLAFMYGTAPWAVRGCELHTEEYSCASGVYGEFEHLVLGAGIELEEHPTHGKVAEMIAELRRDHSDLEIWGYVSMQRHGDEWYTAEAVVARAAAWREIGATGIFLDDFDLCEPGWRSCRIRPDGEESTISRDRQIEVVTGIHDLGMPVFANAHSIHGALGPYRGLASPLGDGDGLRAPDMFLLENPTRPEGGWWIGLNLAAGVAKIHDAPLYAQATGVRIAVLDTDEDVVEDTADATDAYAASFWRAVQAGADAHAFTNNRHSASPGFDTNVPVLDPPAGGEILDDGLRFAPGGVRLLDDGLRSERDLIDDFGDLVATVIATIDDETGEVRTRLVRYIGE